MYVRTTRGLVVRSLYAIRIIIYGYNIIYNLLLYKHNFAAVEHIPLLPSWYKHTRVFIIIYIIYILYISIYRTYQKTCSSRCALYGRPVNREWTHTHTYTHSHLHTLTRTRTHTNVSLQTYCANVYFI